MKQLKLEPEVFERLNAEAKREGKTPEQLIEQIIEEKTKDEACEQAIDYGEVTIRIPVEILRLYREFYKQDPKKAIEHDVIESVRSQVEALTGCDLLVSYPRLNPIFETVLGDPIE